MKVTCYSADFVELICTLFRGDRPTLVISNPGWKNLLTRSSKYEFALNRKLTDARLIK